MEERNRRQMSNGSDDINGGIRCHIEKEAKEDKGVVIIIKSSAEKWSKDDFNISEYEHSILKMDIGKYTH